MASKNSKIEVDLNILQDEALKRLVAFGEQFSKNTQVLADLNLGGTTVGGGAQGTVSRPGQVNPAASTGATVLNTPGVNTTGATVRYGTGAGVGGASVATADGAVDVPRGDGGRSVADMGGGTPGMIGGEGTFEQQYVRAQKRIGAIPVGFREALGYIAESRPQTDDSGFIVNNNGEKLDKNGKVTTDANEFTTDKFAALRTPAAKINSWMFTTQAVSANAKKAMSGLQGVWASVATPTASGMDLGRSRNGGLFGTGIFSSAWKTSQLENLKAGWESDFGLNPNYSPGQAAAANNAIHSYGYSGDTADTLRDQLKQLTIHNQLAPTDAMTYMDPLLRYGNGFQGGQSLIQALKDMNGAAANASMSLKAYQSDMLATSTAVAATLGVQPGQVVGALNTFTDVTGLPPSAAKELFSNSSMTMASALTGTPYAELMLNPGAKGVAPALVYPMMMLKSMTGYTAPELAAMQKKDPKKFYSVMNTYTRMYGQDPSNSIFGGMNPEQLIKLGARNGGALQNHLQTETAIKNATGSNPNYEKILSKYKTKDSTGLINDYKDEVDNWNKAHKHLAKQPAAERQEKRTAALDALQKTQKKTATASKTAITVGLTRDAKKMLVIMNSQTGEQSVSGRNTLGRWAADVSDQALLSDIGLPGVGGAVSGTVSEVNKIGNDIAGAIF